jgi:hypothetical protein
MTQRQSPPADAAHAARNVSDTLPAAAAAAKKKPPPSNPDIKIGVANMEPIYWELQPTIEKACQVGGADGVKKEAGSRGCWCKGRDGVFQKLRLDSSCGPAACAHAQPPAAAAPATRAAQFIAAAGNEGIKLLSFGEGALSGYPW